MEILDHEKYGLALSKGLFLEREAFFEKEGTE